MTFRRLLAISLFVLPFAVAALPSMAQDYDRPPQGFQDDRAGAGGDAGAPAESQDPGGLSVRVGRMEGRIRDMTGQIEELQNANRKLVEQLQKFQADVDSRLTAGAARPKRSDAAPATPASPVVGAAGESGAAMDADGATPRKRRDDAFDPDAASATAPGRPKPLGSTASAESDDAAPMDLSGGKLRRAQGDAAAAGNDTLAPTLRLPPAVPKAVAATPGATVLANASPTGTPREEYDVALGFYRDKQYESAEKGFTAFIQKNPKNRLVADATYYLGESFAQRGRSREAAEQYLKISTDYANSTRAPDAMLHLGISLKAIGAKEQACATFSEVPRKYPNAPAYVRSGAEREAKRAQC
jgi:tol-pal system protein YbgF